MRVLTDPAETGAVTLALPQDVQAEAYDWPEELFERRVWRVRRPLPEPAPLAEAAALLRGAAAPADRRRRRHDLRRGDRRAARARRGDRHPGRRDAGRQGLAALRPPAGSVGAIGATGTTAANALAREADVVLGVGTRWSDFTTASRSLFGAARRALRQPQRRAGRRVQARPGCRSSPTRARGSRRSPRRSRATRCRRAPRARARARREWDEVVERAYTARPRPAARPERGDRRRQPRHRSRRDVVVCAAGSMPGDLHKLWRTRDPKGYHVEYGYSCMGYEIAGGLGVKMAAPEREVVRDGRRRLLPDDGPGARDRRRGGRQAHGRPGPEPRLRSRSARCRSRVGSQRFGTRYRYRRTRDGDAARSTSPPTPPASAPTSLRVVDRSRSFEAALREARRVRAARPSCTSRPTRSSARRAPRRGGTSRSPRSPRSTARAPRAPSYERDKRTQQSRT